MLMSSLGSWGFMEEFLIISGLIGVQIIYAIYAVFLTRLLALGLDSIFLIITMNLASGFLLLPFALVLEKNRWPMKLKSTLLVKVGLFSSAGIAYQHLMLWGLEKTSPAVATAMPNLIPGLIFVIAACLRFEKFAIRCEYSKAKILGTLVCLSGAIAMSFLQTPPAPVSPTLNEPLCGTNNDWIIGCFCLMGAVTALSCSTILQVAKT